MGVAEELAKSLNTELDAIKVISITTVRCGVVVVYKWLAQRPDYSDEDRAAYISKKRGVCHNFIVMDGQ